MKDSQLALKKVTPQIIDQLVKNQLEFKHFLLKRVPQEAVVKDLLQTSLLRAFEKQSTVRNEESVVAWFYQILRNTLIDYYRSQEREGKNTDDLRIEIRALEKENAEWRQETQDGICQCFQRLLTTLKPEYADVLRRADLEEQSLESIARELKLTVNHVTVRLHRARKALKISLERSCGVCASHGCLNCNCLK